MTAAQAAELAHLIVPGCRVAVGDGVGSPRSMYAALSDAARAAGDVELVVGWAPLPDPALRFESFADVRTLMSGWGMRRPLDDGRVRGVPVSLAGTASLLHGPLRPDVLLAAVVPVAPTAGGAGGYAFGSEVSWQQAAVDSGAVVAAVVCHAYPNATTGPPLPADRVVVVGESAAPPTAVITTTPGPGHRALAEQIVRFIPAGARLQLGPGALGAALCDAISTPVRIECGLLPDGVVSLDRRGLLDNTPIATYLAGGQELFDWADGRGLLHGVDVTHDIGRLSSGDAFFAVNQAVEVDLQGQVNAEGAAGSSFGVVGGNPDFAAAGARSIGGLSIIAVPSHHRGKPTLVKALSMPVTMPGHDVDVVITEHGAADLRGLDRNERARAIRALWK